MATYSIKALLSGQAPIDSQVTIRGWVRTRRDSKAGVSFIHVHDGSSFHPIQVVAPSNLTNYHNDILRLTAGCSVVVSGQIVKSPAKGQPYEIQAETIEVMGWVEDPDTYPMQPKHHTLEYLREVAHLRPRTNTIGAVSRIRHVAAQAVHQFFDTNDFFWLPTPIITTSDCEGAGEMFRVSTLDLVNLPYKEAKKVDFSKDFFGQEAFLTVSGQLNAEAYALALTKVYTFGPTFRAENSNTARHLAEFWMVEPEVAFADLEEDANIAEALLKFVFKTVLEKNQDELTFFAERYQKDCITRLESLLNATFERMNYTDAIRALENSKKQFEFPISWGTDLQTEHERYLAEELVKGPVIVMNYPKRIKAFYMRLNEDENTVAAMDVLVPGMGEIIGGSQREERLAILDQRMEEVGLSKTIYEWYRDLRRYGTVPHAGFGLGFERLLSYITGLTNIRDVIPFPRTPGHAKF